MIIRILITLFIYFQFLNIAFADYNYTTWPWSDFINNVSWSGTYYYKMGTTWDLLRFEFHTWIWSDTDWNPLYLSIYNETTQSQYLSPKYWWNFNTNLSKSLNAFWIYYDGTNDILQSVRTVSSREHQIHTSIISPSMIIGGGPTCGTNYSNYYCSFSWNEDTWFTWSTSLKNYSYKYKVYVEDLWIVLWNPLEWKTCEIKYINYPYMQRETFSSGSTNENEYDGYYFLTDDNNSTAVLSNYNSYTWSLFDITNWTWSFFVERWYNPFSGNPILGFQFENSISSFSLDWTWSFDTFTLWEEYTLDKYYKVYNCQDYYFQNYENTLEKEKEHFEFWKTYNLNAWYNELCFEFDVDRGTTLELNKVALWNMDWIQVFETLVCSDNETWEIEVWFQEDWSDLEVYTWSLNDLWKNYIDVIETEDEENNSYIATTWTWINYAWGCKVPISSFGSVHFSLFGFGEIRPLENFDCLLSTVWYFIKPIDDWWFWDYFWVWNWNNVLEIETEISPKLYWELELWDIFVFIIFIAFTLKIFDFWALKTSDFWGGHKYKKLKNNK